MLVHLLDFLISFLILVQVGFFCISLTSVPKTRQVLIQCLKRGEWFCCAGPPGRGPGFQVAASTLVVIYMHFEKWSPTAPSITNIFCQNIVCNSYFLTKQLKKYSMDLATFCFTQVLLAVIYMHFEKWPSKHPSKINRFCHSVMKNVYFRWQNWTTRCFWKYFVHSDLFQL